MIHIKSFNILIDCAGTATAISVIKGLKYQKRYKYKIITIDVDEFVAGRYFSDKFYVVPPANNPKAIEEVLKICKMENIHLFVPIFDLWLPTLSEHAEMFNEIDTFILISKPKTIYTCFDKYETHLFLKENNIPTPRTFTLDEAIEKIENDEIEFPIFIKPRKGGRASINALKINSKEEFYHYIKNSENWVIQEYIDGVEYTVDCLNTLDGKRCLGAVVRKRIETKGGLSVKSEIIYDKELMNYAIKIGKKLEIVGPYNIQCFRDKHGNIYFTEINPRFAGTHAFTIMAGLNSIELILDMLSGIEPEPVFDKIKYGLKMVRFWNEIIIDKNKVYIPWTL